jgi:hypothetical protein
MEGKALSSWVVHGEMGEGNFPFSLPAIYLFLAMLCEQQDLSSVKYANTAILMLNGKLGRTCLLSHQFPNNANSTAEAIQRPMRRNSNPGTCKVFFNSTASRPALGPIQPPPGGIAAVA